MPLQATSGAASYDGFGGGVAAVPNYIEDVFSTYLYTGTGTADNKITNNIDLSTKGGMVWLKSRSGAYNNYLTTNSTTTSSGGGTTWLYSNTTDALLGATGTGLCNFFTDGFDINPTGVGINGSGQTYASWIFRKQPKFFDVVTFSANGTPKTVPHNLGSVPGCILVKRLDGGTQDWYVYHRSAGAGTSYANLNTTDAFQTSSNTWNSTNATATEFTVGVFIGISGPANYVAYLFAHNAGGFGLTGTDNVISCGSFTSTGSALSVNLGYEPQWLLYKESSTTGDWKLIDNMRGFQVDRNGSTVALYPNLSSAESALGLVGPTSTGFTFDNGGSGVTYIYIAIRRGPMKVPTSGTSVFQPLTRNGTGGATTVTSTVRPDTVLQNWRSGGLGSANHFMYDRLRGIAKALFTDTTDAESTQTATGINAFNNLSYGIAGSGSMNNGSALYADYVFTRAPGFFDEVCYTGDGAASRNITHNLTVTPQLIFAKSRSNVANWVAYNFAGNGLILNSAVAANSGFNFITSVTSTTFTPADPASYGGSPNQSGQTYVAYLFATCAGVSKVGSYTGTGATLQIDCGFTGGARFVLIKRTDSTGDWYVWDSARGIVAGNDPYLLLNSTAAEVTTTDYIDTYSAGFEISSTAPAAINASGGTFIFLAIA